jgi:hypothetical protein
MQLSCPHKTETREINEWWRGWVREDETMNMDGGGTHVRFFHRPSTHESKGREKNQFVD